MVCTWRKAKGVKLEAGLMKKIILSIGVGLIDDLSVTFYPYQFVRTILSIPFCPIPFCPYHFVRFHFVLEPLEVVQPYEMSFLYFCKSYLHVRLSKGPSTSHHVT